MQWSDVRGYGNVIALCLWMVVAAESFGATREPSFLSGAKEAIETLPSPPVLAMQPFDAETRDSVHVAAGLCGLCCLDAAMKTFDRPVSIRQLAELKYLNGRRGSSLKDLRKAAEDFGMYSEVVGNLTIADLKKSMHPLILLLKSDAAKPGYDHYELLMPTTGGKALMYDPPRSIRDVVWHEIAARWRGEAVVVSDTPIRLGALVSAGRKRLVMYMLFGAALTAGLLLAHKRWLTLCGEGARAKVWMATAGQSLVLLGVASVLGIGQQRIGEAGFFGSPEVAAYIERVFRAEFIPVVSPREMALALGRRTLLIDARYPADYQDGHIEEAMNIPKGMLKKKREEALAGIDRKLPLIVYCQSRQCHFADEVALDLMSDGFLNVSIFREGWLGWQSRGGKGR